MKKFLIKLMIIITLFINTFTVNALSSLSLSVSYDSSRTSEMGSVYYKVDDGVWNEISNNNSYNLDGENIYLKVEANYGYMPDFDGVVLVLDGVNHNINAGDESDIRDALVSSEGYELVNGEVSLSNVKFMIDDHPSMNKTANFTIEVTGENLEYHHNPPTDLSIQVNGKSGDDRINFSGENATWIGGSGPEDATGVRTTNPISHTYQYDNSGNITLYITNQANTKITSFIVNDVDYASDCPSTDEELLSHLSGLASNFEIVIPYADNYDIKVEATTHDLIGNFGWTYVDNDSEDSIAHGKLEFISATLPALAGDASGTYTSVNDYNSVLYNGTGEIAMWHDGNKNYSDESEAWGGAYFIKGTTFTVRLIPDAGYQLTGLFGTDETKGTISPENEVGVYTIEVKQGLNAHLYATFEEVNNETNNTHNAVSEGEISLNDDLENIIDNGTVRFNVAEVDNIDTNNFEEKAQEENYEIQEYLDLNLENIIHKASEDSNDAWVTDADLSNTNANVTLTLNEPLDGEVIVLHEKHDGTIETIEANYDSENKVLSFDTSSFSNYAIASRSSGGHNVVVNTDGHGSPDSDNPTSLDAGEQHVFLIVEPNEGYVYDRHEATGINEDEEEGYSMAFSGWPTIGIVINKMPDNDIEFMIYFAEAITVTFDANGGTPGDMWENERIIKKGQQEDNPFIYDEDFVKAPDGYEYDGVEINGTKYGPDDSFTFDEDVVIIYQWKEIEEPVDTTTLIIDLNGAQAGDDYPGEIEINVGEELEIPTEEVISAIAMAQECKKYGGLSYGNKTYAPGTVFIIPNENPVTLKIVWNDNHDYGEWKIIKEATETQTGLMERICKNNPNHKETKIIPAKGTNNNRRIVPNTKAK